MYHILSIDRIALLVTVHGSECKVDKAQRISDRVVGLRDRGVVGL